MEGYPHFRSSGIQFPTLLHQIAFFDTLFPTHCENIIYAVFRQSIGAGGGLSRGETFSIISGGSWIAICSSRVCRVHNSVRSAVNPVPVYQYKPDPRFVTCILHYSYFKAWHLSFLQLWVSRYRLPQKNAVQFDSGCQCCRGTCCSSCKFAVFSSYPYLWSI